MSDARNKPSPEELMREILEDTPERDDAEDIAAMTAEEIELELKAGGYTPEGLRKSKEREMEMIRSAVAKVDALDRRNASDAPPRDAPVVVPLRRRRALRWTLLAAALVAAALAAMPAIEMLATEDVELQPLRTKAPHETPRVARQLEDTYTEHSTVPVLPGPTDSGSPLRH